MATLADLPTELLVLICRELPLFSLYNLRRANSRLAALIKENSTGISAWVAHRTFSDAVLATDDSQIKDFEWLNSKILDFLAAVLVDRIQDDSFDLFGGPYGITAEDDRSHFPRVRITKGLQILRQLSKIYNDAKVQMPKPSFRNTVRRALRTRSFKNTMKQVLRSRSFKMSPSEELEYKEDFILKLRISYLRKLKKDQIRDFRFACAILFSMIKTQWDNKSVGLLLAAWAGPDYTASRDYFDWTEAEQRKRQERPIRRGGSPLTDGTSWVNWCLLKDGLRIFWLQYVLLSPKFVKEYLLREWESRSEEQVGMERKYGTLLERALRELDGGWAGEQYLAFIVVPQIELENTFWLPYRHSPVRAISPSTAEMTSIPHRVMFRNPTAGQN
ncbi:hypothetical protein BT63DRAFT_484493 [Microthyrium microscopicum]|uniref:F-box domain-containing protein n=1 Tax=Microthyrium microscopicum TaxID=703497 RepID=A0A6A6TTM1_9PEZI|nr:hypothetical protein BT63DRAFT_484493 [Microthyrium microscopicum]